MTSSATSFEDIPLEYFQRIERLYREEQDPARFFDRIEATNLPVIAIMGAARTGKSDLATGAGRRRLA